MQLVRAWELKEQVRYVYEGVDPADARIYLNGVVRPRAAQRAARRIGDHVDGLVADIEPGLSNSRLEGINARSVSSTTGPTATNPRPP